LAKAERSRERAGKRRGIRAGEGVDVSEQPESKKPTLRSVFYNLAVREG
jgi:hypothetical protein